jgi:hypothetical protein
MNATAKIFWVIAVFALLMDAVYIAWNLLDPYSGKIELVGTLALPLVAIMSIFIAFYLRRLGKSLDGELPEDRLNANIDDGDAEQGHFSPWSWWPIFLGAAAGFLFLGLAIGWWIALIGVPFVLVGVVGWNYEYYRGNFGR